MRDVQRQAIRGSDCSSRSFPSHAMDINALASCHVSCRTCIDRVIHRKHADVTSARLGDCRRCYDFETDIKLRLRLMAEG